MDQKVWSSYSITKIPCTHPQYIHRLANAAQPSLQAPLFCRHPLFQYQLAESAAQVEEHKQKRLHAKKELLTMAQVDTCVCVCVCARFPCVPSVRVLFGDGMRCSVVCVDRSQIHEVLALVTTTRTLSVVWISLVFDRIMCVCVCVCVRVCSGVGLELGFS